MTRGCLVLLCVSSCLSVLPAMCQPADSPALPKPYLLLVTFNAPRLRDWQPDALALLDESPFAGVASTVGGAYDTDPVRAVSEFDGAVKHIRNSARKHVWPWVFTNRFIGRGERTHTSAGKQAPEYFTRIKGWDLSGQAGAQADFLKLWRGALNLARQLGAPGIVLDLEAYNAYESYSLASLAKTEELPEEEVTRRLSELGREMTDIVAEEYPHAVIWSLFLQFGPQTAVRYLLEGMLESAKQQNVPLQLVEGGETTVGYYNPSLAVLQGRLRTRAEDLAPWLTRFPERLRLGGTISPYSDPEQLTSWIKRTSESGGRVFQNAREFRPLFEELFASCEYLWIYAASASGYLPFADGKRAAWSPIHAELAELCPKWQAAYRLLPLPRTPTGLRQRQRQREFQELAVRPESWLKGDPNTDMKQAEVTLGIANQAENGDGRSLKFHVEVDWENPRNSEYPVGWPMVHRDFEPALDLTGHDVLEFKVSIHTDAKLPSAPLKYGLSNDGKEPAWQKVVTDRTDEWVHVRLPLAELPRRDRITRLTFYIAENWYRHGDVITFYLDGIRFLRQTTPEIREFHSEPWVVRAGDAAVDLTCRLIGDTDVQGSGLKLSVRERATGKDVDRHHIRSPQPETKQRIAISAWQPGVYDCTAQLLRGEAVVDEVPCTLAITE